MGKLGHTKYFFSILILILLNFFSPFVIKPGAEALKNGGGYAASGQIKDVSFTAKIYDATNGLPTSDANCVLGAKNGYMWIGGYAG
ncbi:MAG: hypothetical protein K5931_02800, partial [Lachnospiraceae bacterium]|nr:hypothetical protein [Lachnospiraceae bacterium]